MGTVKPTGHYYIDQGQTVDHLMQLMPNVIAHSGPQLVHYHKHGERCIGHVHELHDQTGSHRVEEVETHEA